MVWLWITHVHILMALQLYFDNQLLLICNLCLLPLIPNSCRLQLYHQIAWAADKLSDDELELTTGESAISPILEDEGELDDGIVTTANSGSGAQGALERRRKEDGRWGDLGLDLFEGNKMEVGSSGQGGGG